MTTTSHLPQPGLPGRRPGREIPLPLPSPVEYLPRDPGSMPEVVVCHRCDRRAMHCWAVATGRDDHTCCTHYVLAGGEPLPIEGHPECAAADDALLGRRPASEVFGDVEAQELLDGVETRVRALEVEHAGHVLIKAEAEAVGDHAAAEHHGAEIIRVEARLRVVHERRDELRG